MEYTVSFTMFLDQDEEVDKEFLRGIIVDNLNSAGASIEKVVIETVKIV